MGKEDQKTDELDQPKQKFTAKELAILAKASRSKADLPSSSLTDEEVSEILRALKAARERVKPQAETGEE
ncbi:MAG: hypothetical protein AAB551_01695 [Patescibacteria group bacterium]